MGGTPGRFSLVVVGLIGALLACLLLVGCGSSREEGESGAAADTVEYRVPGHDVSVRVPSSWDAVDSTCSTEELERFQREHPSFLNVEESCRYAGGDVLLAAEPSGKTRLYVTVRFAGADKTLRQHMRENLQGFESDELGQLGLEITIEGPREEIVALPGAGESWRLRWSYEGDLGPVHLLQHTLVQHGYTYMFSYSTMKPYAQVAELFDRSSESIRIGTPTAESEATAGGLIAFSHEGEDDAPNITVINADGSGQRQLTTTGSDWEPAWSPDGERLAFVSERDGNAEIYVMNADGSDQRRLTDNTVADGMPSWSPDGKDILFTRESGEDNEDLYVIRADGGDERRITSDGSSTYASYSPDGSKIALWHERDFRSGIYVMNPDGSDLTFLTERFEYAWGADWSPDGKEIVLVGTDEDERQAIWVMNADGRDIRLVAVATGYWIDEPDWSPEGTEIAYFSDTLGPGDIWVMNADGSHQRPLTNGGDNHDPSWQPGR